MQFFEGEPLAVKGDAFGGEIAAADAGDLGTELAKAEPSGAGILFPADHSLGRNCEVAGEPGGHGACELLIIKVFDELEGELLLLPLAEAALAPLGEINGVDGAARKVSLKDTLDLRHVAEPIDEGFSDMAILKALVKLFADGVGEASDFSVASHGIVGLMDEWIDGVVGLQELQSYIIAWLRRRNLKRECVMQET